MNPEILIVDNDPLVCKLSNELLREAGFTTQMIQDGKMAIPAIRENHPRAVLLDILMPGVDGLNLCRTIKSDPALRNTKVIIVSGKTFDVEKERAKRYGADLFIDKPYDVDSFAQTVIKTIGSPKSPAPLTTGPSSSMSDLVQLHVWGCRSLNASLGTSVTPPKGLQTPCVSIETEDRLFIFDAGSGLVTLGESLLGAGKHKEIWLFITHFHLAHIGGLGTFPCTRVPGYNLRICGPNDPDKTLEQCVRGAFQGSFAVNPQPVKASIQLFVLQEGDYDLAPGLRVHSFYTNHPTTTLGFSLETLGRKIVYCPDSELYGSSATALQDYDEMLSSLCRDADIFIHDARYRAQDYTAHKNQGHSSLADTIEFASHLELGRLMLFHQDAAYSSQDIDAMEKEAQALLKTKGSSLICTMAREGTDLKL